MKGVLLWAALPWDQTPLNIFICILSENSNAIERQNVVYLHQKQILYFLTKDNNVLNNQIFKNMYSKSSGYNSPELWRFMVMQSPLILFPDCAPYWIVVHPLSFVCVVETYCPSLWRQIIVQPLLWNKESTTSWLEFLRPDFYSFKREQRTDTTLWSKPKNWVKGHWFLIYPPHHDGRLWNKVGLI